VPGPDHFTAREGTPSRLRLKCNDKCAETRFRLSAKTTSPLKSAKASFQSTTESRGVRISGSNAGYTVFRGSVKGTGYPLHSPVSPSLPLPYVTVCHHISTGLYPLQMMLGKSSRYEPADKKGTPSGRKPTADKRVSCMMYRLSCHPQPMCSIQAFVMGTTQETDEHIVQLLTDDVYYI